ncbi:DUF6458 family protein [Microbacterium sp. NC79]|uniref:DUF6458 family protein n=1 Tax=Microbacterium sp. NC79 TaxID=2851009 RepID=UPI001C2C85E8|nr:DUF6458 family protein [Microbacterium sp. NC79]MBV0896209.1 hypothetical protein [Microbacterium sp. NC79]
MTIGFGIFIFVVGAILAFALNFEVDWVDLNLVGYIMMGAGALMFIIGLAVMFSRRSSSSVSSTQVDPASGNRVTRTETQMPNDQV